MSAAPRASVSFAALASDADVPAADIAPPNGMPKPFEIGPMSEFETACQMWELMG